MVDPKSPHERSNSSVLPRRQFAALGAGAGISLFAGCMDDLDLQEMSDSNDSDSLSGTFRLLISDMPADIGDFERLDVSFDSARIFKRQENESDDVEISDDVDNSTTDNSSNITAADGDEELNDTTDDGSSNDDSVDEISEDNPDDEPNSGDQEEGFFILDLDGATVDLTQVVGDVAMPIFEGELDAGTYNKIELHVADIEGIVDGEVANVTVPSDKLQIVRPFEIVPDEAVSFVFDINVVRRGRGLDYNLTPVIAKSGVVGDDVDVEELPADNELPNGGDDANNSTEIDDGGEDDIASEAGNDSATESGGDPQPDDSEGDHEAGGPPDQDDDSPPADQAR